MEDIIYAVGTLGIAEQQSQWLFRRSTVLTRSARNWTLLFSCIVATTEVTNAWPSRQPGKTAGRPTSGIWTNINTGCISVQANFCPKKTMFTFFQAHSHTLTNATRHYQYSRGSWADLPVPGVLVSFLELCCLGKMALLALGGLPQPLKKPSQSQKGYFYEKMNALNDTKTSELSKYAEGNGEYLWSSVAFVEAGIKSKFPNGF